MESWQWSSPKRDDLMNGSRLFADDEDVKIAVGKNFEEIVLDESKDTLLEVSRRECLWICHSWNKLLYKKLLEDGKEWGKKFTHRKHTLHDHTDLRPMVWTLPRHPKPIYKKPQSD